MKKTLNDLARFAHTVSMKKFQKLSSTKQHEMLAAMAYQSIEENAYDAFLKRYDELQHHTDLDRYSPPSWLSSSEALMEFYGFHSAFCNAPVQPAESELRTDVEWKPAFNVQIMLDQIRSPYNAGSVLRLIDNFGFQGLIHSTPTLSFDHPQLKKAARGCERWIPVRCETDPIRFMNATDLPVIGIERTGDAVPVSDWEPPAACILVAGNEEYGISDQILDCCTQVIEIPMFGFKKSMNVHHAISVVAQKFVETNF